MKPIDGEPTPGPNPYPSPPPEWRPSGLTRAEEGPLERALYERVRRTAIAQRCGLREAAEIVRFELEGPCS